jgi:DNA-binding CsgD family transcriptional regulator
VSLEDSRPSPTHGGWPPQAGFAAILLGITALLAWDLATDRMLRHVSTAHLIVEGLAALSALGAAAWVLTTLRRQRREMLRLKGDLARSKAEAERWRAEASELLRGLSHAIDQQFDRWDLSPAEREVALLLLKGLSTRDIADLRRTREATVRQQAQGVYRKAGLEGRAELAAFFLEDLLAPAVRPDQAP